MKDIIFRGKRTDTGEWVEGFYVCLGDTFHYILSGKLDLTRSYVMFEKYEIDPESLGQYTGKSDKNGTKIFEGDIVKIKGKIRYIFYGTSSFRHTNYGEYAAELRDVFTEKYCEIIGNIYDNPELLRSYTE